MCTCIELLWAWLEEHVLSRPEVWSATAGWVGAGVALYIGFVAHQFNKNARRGQVMHEQIKMVLDIDSELTANPELWEAHGKRFRLSILPTMYPVEGRMITKPQLRLLAFVLRYFNMFDSLYGFYGREGNRLSDEDRESWIAWKEYMIDFFSHNDFAYQTWAEFGHDKKIYSPIFKTFMESQILPVSRRRK